MSERGTRSNTAADVAAMGAAFSRSIRASIGPAYYIERARERYFRGEIEANELECELDRIAKEFGADAIG